MWTWLVRLFGGFKFWSGSVPFERLGKILFVLIICVGVCFGFWKIFLEKKVQNIEKYMNCNVTQNRDCSEQVQSAVSKAAYKPLLDLKVWKLIRIGIGG
jgi:hypothetical protein